MSGAHPVRRPPSARSRDRKRSLIDGSARPRAPAASRSRMDASPRSATISARRAAGGRRRARPRPRHRGHPHALRRPAHLGSVRDAVDLAGRDHRRDRQLRLHHRAVPPAPIATSSLRNLTHVEGMSLEALRAGVSWDFETYPEYLGTLERRGMVPNVASFVGHSSVRTYVLGDDATERAGHRGRDRARCGASCSRRCAPARSASPPPRSSSTTARTACRCPRAWPTSASCTALTGALGEAGRGVFMLTKGMTSTVPWLEKIAAAQRPAGDDRRDVRRSRRSDPRVPTSSSEIERSPHARARAVGAGRLLPARHGVHAAPSLPARGVPGLASGHRGRRRGERYRRVLADPSFRATLKDEVAQSTGVPNRFSDKTWIT